MTDPRRRMKRSTPGLVAGLAVSAALASAAGSPAATTTYTHAPGPIVNPERGMFIQHTRCERQPFDPAQLARYRTEEAISLVRCVFYLPKTSDIRAEIAELDAQAARVRAGGAKMIVRFAYTESTAGDDAPPARVQEHLGALTDSLRRNSDVIALMESGFVGAWGEGYYTQHFGNEGVVDPDEWAARNAVVDRLLRILPPGRKVAVRTPKMKWQMFGEASATAAAFNAGSDIARVGHVNDCFLRNELDSGTYTPERKSDEYAYLARDTQYVPMLGETCGRDEETARSECPTALRELKAFHYTSMNARYHPDVLGDWTSGGCMEEIRQRLGYRLALVSVTTPTSVVRGASLPFAMTVRNHGWSTPVNSRPVHLVLRSRTPAAKATYRFPLTNAKGWAAQATRTFQHAGVKIPTTVPAGAYDMLLSLPDPAPALASKPAYAVQLANAGTWESSTGLNRLGRTVTVK